MHTEKNPVIEVKGKMVSSFVNALEIGKEERQEILENHGVFIGQSPWFPQASIQQAFQKIASSQGPMSMFLIGRSMALQSELGSMNTLYDVLEHLNTEYYRFHRVVKNEGDKDICLKEVIGQYTLVDFDESNCEAYLLSTSPYSNELDRGLITQLIFDHLIDELSIVEVTIQKETVKMGKYETLFYLSWKSIQGEALYAMNLHVEKMI